MRTHACTGFTLVELLVVVTIIIVLLAMLAPALEKAVYQAELAACGANMKAVSNGAMAYALGNRRLYPERQMLRNTSQNVSNTTEITWEGVFPNSLRRPASNTTPASDDRPLFQEFMGLGSLLDACAGKVNLSVGANAPNAYVSASRLLWFGWQYRIPEGGVSNNTTNVGGSVRSWKPMRRIGDRWTWFGRGPLDDAEFERVSSLLASDMDGVTLFGGQGGGNMASHPDADNVMKLDTFENQSNGFAIAVSSNWGVANQGRLRGTLDNNYAHDDGAVVRINGLAWDDERLASVPVTTAGTGIFNYFWNIPRE